MNKRQIARVFVGSCAALLMAAAVPAKAQVPASGPDTDGRYVEEYPPQGDEDEVVPEEVTTSEGAPDAGDSYVDPSAPAPAPEGYVVADDCAYGCDVTSWDAPYVAPYFGTTIVFGAPVFRLGHWYRPYYHRAYYGSRYRSYTRPSYRSYGYGSGWRRGSSYRSYVAPRTYGTYRSYGGSRGWTGTRTWGGGQRSGGGTRSGGWHQEHRRR